MRTHARTPKSGILSRKSLENQSTERFEKGYVEVEFHITAAIPIEPDLLSDIEELAQKRGIKAGTLINLWLKEKVIEMKAE